MDINIDLLGPYASHLKALQFKAVPFNSKSSKPPKVKPSQPPPTRANFGALHKKQNVKFLQDTDYRRQGRHMQLEEVRKEKRSELFMQRRKSNMTEITNELNQLIHDESNEISALECSDVITLTPIVSNSKTKVGVAEGNRNNKNGPAVAQNRNNINSNINSRVVQNGKQTPLAAATSQAQARREQLLKWKKEKEAADSLAKRGQRQPFKVGATTAAAGNKNGIVTKPGTSILASNQSKGASSLLSGSATTLTSRTGGIATKPTNGAISSRPATAGGVSTATARGTGAASSKAEPLADPRRVTRAMSKAQTGTQTVSSIGSVTGVSNKSSATAIKPAIQKMKTLNISEKTTSSKPGVTGNKGPPSQVAKPGQISASARPVTTIKKAAVPVSSSSSTSKTSKAGHGVAATSRSHKSTAQKAGNPDAVNSSQETTDDSTVNEEAKEQKTIKKVKPKPIDATYIDYNAKFSSACLKLTSYATEWSKILNTPAEMPEDTQGDIHSALGKVKLLLDSKLPQFGELLYSYLCDLGDPKLLPCDLEGWWDVVTIQLEAVDSMFEGLSKRKENNWEKETPMFVFSASHESNEGNKTKKGTLKTSGPSRSKSSMKAQASGGLKAFLASKRKMVNNNENLEIPGEEPMEVAYTSQDISNQQQQKDNFSSPSSNLADKTFEGGFFTISSPLVPPRTPDSRRLMASSRNCSLSSSSSSHVPPALRTPSRRLSSCHTSLKRASLSILNVRQSMGSFTRIGAVPISLEKQDEINQNINLGEN